MVQSNRFALSVSRILLWLIILVGISAVSIGRAQTIERGQEAVTVTPSNTGIGRPGETVIYQHNVKNTGTQSDTFDLTAVSSQGWFTSISPDVVTLGPNQQEMILVTVVVALNAQFGDIDVTTVTATSQASPGTTGSATDTTIVPIPMYMPMISNNSGQESPDCQLVIPPPGNPQGVDLVVTAISLNPNPPQAGQQTTVRVTVKNQGQTDVTPGNNFLIDFYDNPSPEPPGPLQPGTIYWGAQGVNFEAGESQTFVATYSFTAGFHKLYAQVDTDGTVNEANDSNNVYGCLGIDVN